MEPIDSKPSIKTLAIDDFVQGLCSISERDFGIGTVYEYLKLHPVDENSIQKYLFFSKNHYTRNLIFKNDRFELMSICWEIGQASMIHNHHNQNCWMSIPIGKLRIQNFRVIGQDEKAGFCRLEPTDAFDIHRSMPAEVDPAQPIHQVLNLPEFNSRAVSLHIYSRPFDRCLVYSTTKNDYREIDLKYTSQYGHLCEGARL